MATKRITGTLVVAVLLLFGMVSQIPNTGGMAVTSNTDRNTSMEPMQSTYDGVKASDLNIPTLDDVFSYEIDIVFLGINQTRINESLLEENIPSWYAPIDRYDRFYGRGLQFDVNYTINYNFNYIDNSSIQEMRNYFFNNSQLNDEPSFSQDDNDTYYIPSTMVESYLKNNFMTNNRPTLFFMDLYSINPDRHHEHLYNVSEVDLDGDSVPRPYGSEYQNAGGGKENRLLWLDLSVGGTDYRDTPISYSPYAGVNDTLIPNVWDSKYDGNTYNLTIDLSKYISTAIELRYLPSYLYTPGSALEEIKFEFTMINLDTSGFDFMSEIDADYITNSYSKLNPMIDWTYSMNDWDWQSNQDFVDMINQARNDTSKTYSGWQILDWLDNNYLSLVNQSSSEKLVIPIFLFALPSVYTFGSFLGIANNIDGEFAYVVSMTNVYWSTPGYKLSFEDWYSSTSVSIAGQSYKWVNSNNIEGNYHEIFETNFSSSSQLNIYMTDEENFEDYQNGNMADFEVLYNASDTTSTSFNVSVEIRDYYYWIIENEASSSTTFDISIDQLRDRSFGFTFVSMHEAGHAIGLAHPHDGFTWQGNNVYSENTDYLYWLWDLSYTQMTYAAHHNEISVMDKDSSMRGQIPIIYDKASDKMLSLISDLINRGHKYIPESLVPMFENAQSLLEQSEDVFNNYDNLNNLNESISLLYSAYDILQSIDAVLSANQDLFEIEINAVSDTSIDFSKVNYELELNNGTVINGTLPSSGQSNIAGVSFTDYQLIFKYEGDVVGNFTGKTWKIPSEYSLTIPEESSSEDTEETSGFTIPFNWFYAVFGLLATIPVLKRKQKR